MAKVTEYPRIAKMKDNDILLVDGPDGTRTILKSNAAKELGGDIIAVSKSGGNDKVTLNLTDSPIDLATEKDLDGVADALLPIGTASGTPAVVTDAKIGTEFKELKAGIELVQAGTGDPTPENVRSITGWTGAKVTRCGKNILKVEEGSATKVGWNWYIPLSIAPGTYTISCQHQLGSTDVRPSLRNANRGLVKLITAGYAFGNATSVVTFTVSEEEAAKTAFIMFEPTQNTLTFEGVVAGMVQLELGLEATEYEPYSGDTYEVTFPSEAGTVYGGTLDVTAGTLMVTWAKATPGGVSWIKESGNLAGRFYTDAWQSTITKSGSYNTGILCSHYWPGTNMSPPSDANDYQIARHYTGNVYIIDRNYTDKTAEEFKQHLIDDDVQIVIMLATPRVYELTPMQIEALTGLNIVWADCGPVELMYVKDVQVQEMIAEESDGTASRAFTAGEYVIIKDKLYKVTADISSGAELIPDTNIEETTVGGELNRIEGETEEDVSELKTQLIYPTSEYIPVTQGYWAAVDGSAVSSDKWCKTDFLFKDINLRTSRIKMFLLAYNSADDSYVGMWDGSDFTQTYSEGNAVYQIAIPDFVKSYPNYRFRVDFFLQPALSPSRLYSELNVNSLFLSAPSVYSSYEITKFRQGTAGGDQSNPLLNRCTSGYFSCKIGEVVTITGNVSGQKYSFACTTTNFLSGWQTGEYSYEITTDANDYYLSIANIDDNTPITPTDITTLKITITSGILQKIDKKVDVFANTNIKKSSSADYWAQGAWTIADGEPMVNLYWIKSADFLDERTAALINHNNLLMYLQAWSKSTGSYIGTWDGTDFTTTYVEGSGLTYLNLVPFKERYPDYIYKISIKASSRNNIEITPQTQGALVEILTYPDINNADNIIPLKPEDIYELGAIGPTSLYENHPVGDTTNRARMKKETIMRIPDGATSVSVAIGKEAFADGKYKIGWAQYDDSFGQISATILGFYTTETTFTQSINSSGKYWMFYIATVDDNDTVDISTLPLGSYSVVFDNSAVDYGKQILYPSLVTVQDRNERNFNALFTKPLDNSPKGIFGIMTYNVGGWYIGSGTNVPNGKYNKFITLQKNILDRYMPDVLCLQEYWDDFSADATAVDVLLGERFRNIATAKGDTTYHGKAICTSQTMVDAENINFTGENRNYEKAYIYCNGKKVCFISAHLSLTNSQIISECTELLSAISGEEYVVIALDSNVDAHDPDTTLYNASLKQFTDAGYNVANNGNYITYGTTDKALDTFVTTSNIEIKSLIVDNQKDGLSEGEDHFPFIMYAEIY